MNYHGNNYGDQYSNQGSGYGQGYNDQGASYGQGYSDQGTNYGQTYNDQGSNYGQAYNNTYGGQQYDNSYGGQQPDNQAFSTQQYDNQFGNPPYNAQQYNSGQQPEGSQYGSGRKQKPQTFAFDVDFSKITDDTSPEQVARMMLGEKNPYANDLKGLKISENSTRDLKDFNMKDLEDSSRDTERGLFSGFGGNGKSKKSHQLLGGAAAWAALNWYQTKSRNQGKKVSHGFAKKLMVAFAAAQAIKYWEQNSKSFQNGVSRDLVIAEATRSASIAADISASNDVTPLYKYDTSIRGGEADSFDKHDQPQQQPQQQYSGFSNNQSQQFNSQQPQYSGYDNSQQQQYGGYDNNQPQQQYGGDNNQSQQQYGGGYNNQYGGGYSGQY
ncbi:hypothetical protein IWW37_000729 [Coemansia sp. RSA 2050]|nr:hypothetical protein IWW37_000729 [Coemansia sp. RSA 2050]